VEAPLPAAKAELARHAAALTPADRPGDHAQAMMDLGATICTPRRPACALCPLAERCEGRRAGIAESLPRKAPKPDRPLRQGTVWVARRADGALLLERRPPRGLLGGMLGFPGTGWDRRDGGGGGAPLAADWRAAPVGVRHTFTHFDLYLTVLVAEAAADAVPLRGAFHAPGAVGPGDLPTVMRKVHDAAAAAFVPR